MYERGFRPKVGMRRRVLAKLQAVVTSRSDRCRVSLGRERQVNRAISWAIRKCTVIYVVCVYVCSCSEVEIV